MSIIVTYDVPSKHVELKKALFEKGYQDFIIHINQGVKKTIYLPNTTVYHPTNTARQGRDDLRTIAATLYIKLERCVSTQWGPDWAAVYGAPFGG